MSSLFFIELCQHCSKKCDVEGGGRDEDDLLLSDSKRGSHSSAAGHPLPWNSGRSFCLNSCRCHLAAYVFSWGKIQKKKSWWVLKIHPPLKFFEPMKYLFLGDNKHFTYAETLHFHRNISLTQKPVTMCRRWSKEPLNNTNYILCFGVLRKYLGIQVWTSQII